MKRNQEIKFIENIVFKLLCEKTFQTINEQKQKVIQHEINEKQKDLKHLKIFNKSIRLNHFAYKQVLKNEKLNEIYAKSYFMQKLN